MRSTTLILVLSTLAAGLSSAHPITGGKDGGDASSGDAGNARGGDIIINQKGQVKTDPAASPGFWNYQGGQSVTTGNGGVASSGTAYGTDGKPQVKRQEHFEGQLERRLLDGGSENTQSGGLLGDLLGNYDNTGANAPQKRLLDGGSENTQSGGLLGDLLGNYDNTGANAPPQKRLLDGGSENTQSGGLLGNLLGNDNTAPAPQAQRRLLDGGSENTQSGGLLDGLLSRDQHRDLKRLLDGGSEIDRCGGKGMSKRLLDGGSEITTCNQGFLDNLVSRGNTHVKRILDFFNAEESSSSLPLKRLLDFGRGQKFTPDNEVTYVDRQSNRAPESKRFLAPAHAKEMFETGEQIMDAHAPSKRLLDVMSAPDQEPPSGPLDGILGRSYEHEEKRSIGEIFENFGELAKSGKKLGGATGGQRLESGNGGNSSSGNAFAGDAALTGGNGGDASTGSAGDVSGGSIILQQKRQEAEAAEAVEAAEPKELTPMDKSIAAAGGFAGSKLGKMTHFDMLAEAAAPAAPLLQEQQ